MIKLKCVKVSSVNSLFTLNKEYDLFNGYITDDYGIRWVFGSWDSDYNFEKVD